MAKGFEGFADSVIGSWIINGFAVIAFILVVKLIAAQFLPDSGPAGAVKGGIAAI
jgi:hypothetical protein